MMKRDASIFWKTATVLSLALILVAATDYFDSIKLTGALYTDTVTEKSAAAGVTIDGLNIRDGGIGLQSYGAPWVATTMSGGQITVTQTCHTLSGSGTLTQINGGSDGDLLRLRHLGAGNTYVDIAETGNIVLDVDSLRLGLPAGGTPIRHAEFIFNSSHGNWWHVSSSRYTDDQGVTSVTGTSPIVSSGGATPAISITAATALTPGSMSAAHYATVNAISAYGTVYIDAGAMVPCTTAGAATGTTETSATTAEMDYYAFDGGATEERVQFKMVMPNDWGAGTIKAKFHWGSAVGSTAGDTVEWAMKAVCIRNDDALNTAFGTPQVISDTLLANNGLDMQVSGATPAITIGGTPTAGSMVVVEVYRNTDGTDDMAEDAWLFGVQIQYTKSTTAAAGW
jgi:hypothetical protein